MVSDLASDEGPMLDILAIRPEQWNCSPQVGTPCTMTWPMIVAWLGRVTWWARKDCDGAWSPALYRENTRRKSHLVHASMLVVDVDEAGDVDRVAGELGAYRAIVHETFSSTPEAPRCRIVLALASPIDAPTYERVHAVVRRHLATVGILADDGAKDASRASYVPVRRPGSGYRFRTVDGRALDAARVLAAQPPPAPRPAPRAVDPSNREAYVLGARCRAAEAVATASPGGRHHELARQSWSLVRLGLGEADIMTSLLPAWVLAAGEPRRTEGMRTIRDAVRARQGAA